MRKAARRGIRRAVRGHFIREKFNHLAERDAPMAVQVFFFARDLRECFAERRKKENGIVAEATAPLGLVEQQAVGLLGYDGVRRPAVGEGDDADEMGAAVI